MRSRMPRPPDSTCERFTRCAIRGPDSSARAADLLALGSALLRDAGETS